jgi:hypothetical protein
MVMAAFKGQFTRIKGVSERRRLPRLGKIRLGVKAVSTKSGKEYPREVDYFVVPDEIAKVYGDRPKELDVMIPVNDLDIIFPQKYTWYGQSRGPKCIGDGERAMRVNEQGEFEERECPCELLEEGKCQRRAHLMLILPKVSLGGVYQIDLGSYHSIVDINSGLEYVEALIGRFAMVPLKLRRVPRDTYGSGSKQVHYTLSIHADVNIDMLNTLRENTQKVLMGTQYALPLPESINPAMDEGKVEYIDEESMEGEVIEEQDDIPDFEPPPKEEKPKEEKRGPGRPKKEANGKYEKIQCDNPDSSHYNRHVSEVYCASGSCKDSENCATAKQLKEKYGY